MSNRVYTYTKVSELKNAPYFKEIAPLPQLTLSREMAVNMSYDMKIFKGNIMGFLNFSQRLFPGWNTAATARIRNASIPAIRSIHSTTLPSSLPSITAAPTTCP